MPGARLSGACFFSIVWNLPLKGLLIIPFEPLSRKNQKAIIHAETLREVVVALSLDSGDFSCNMRSINQRIKLDSSNFSCVPDDSSGESGRFCWRSDPIYAG